MISYTLPRSRSRFQARWLHPSWTPQALPFPHLYGFSPRMSERRNRILSYGLYEQRRSVGQMFVTASENSMFSSPSQYRSYALADQFSCTNPTDVTWQQHQHHSTERCVGLQKEIRDSLPLLGPWVREFCMKRWMWRILVSGPVFFWSIVLKPKL